MPLLLLLALSVSLSHSSIYFLRNHDFCMPFIEWYNRYMAVQDPHLETFTTNEAIHLSPNGWFLRFRIPSSTFKICSPSFPEWEIHTGAQFQNWRNGKVLWKMWSRSIKGYSWDTFIRSVCWNIVEIRLYIIQCISGLHFWHCYDFYWLALILMTLWIYFAIIYFIQLIFHWVFQYKRYRDATDTERKRR